MDDSGDFRRYRAVFLSDIHLGTRGCQAEWLLDFLRGMSCEHLYLVGDIIDGWQMRKGLHWPQTHNDVIQKMLRLGRKGARITYVPGNHDSGLRDFAGEHFGGVVVAREAVHTCADGRRLLVLHGDMFDSSIRHGPVIAYAAHITYVLVLWLNTLFARFGRRFGGTYFSLAAWLKTQSRNAQRFVDRFEMTAAAEAGRRGLDGIVCGHIHQAQLRNIDGVTYANDGDWVESCTALVEHFDGRLEILNWAKSRSWSMMEVVSEAELLIGA
jgi:UDP-2,3-diacylglucosamine pyrophosphatase LpxH